MVSLLNEDSWKIDMLKALQKNKKKRKNSYNFRGLLFLYIRAAFPVQKMIDRGKKFSSY